LEPHMEKDGRGAAGKGQNSLIRTVEKAMCTISARNLVDIIPHQ